ncbi:gamma-glutamyl-gamma-aminobutyrate hydrolase family protein [Agreia sp. VKM Ac-1783]|uniref:gamma-glutamyl-gamma-aminobutyrate hydrolase family protein n=1 Tax=Agreia sp. VKM Ac-1783 TaxID=1938889 RepID=UPI000A2AEDA2|nr:gamma-glutamyl-gamma-aminobutyrate hydrolase family protein [Agreia sp. VKM Ac-1783]SMQ61021.1 putative glutamine amidotransferase [Agreia sp. VKM Ac-1783]
MSASDRLPVIGLTTYLERAKTGVWDVPASFLPKVYFDAVEKAGGIAVLLPPQAISEAIADRLLDSLDGLILTGGKDIEPSRYGQDAHPETDEPRPDRDAWEDTLLRRAIEREIPFLGICRGAQMLNVARGGTLHQHLPDVVGDRRYQAGQGIFNHVEVSVAEDSRLAGLLSDTIDVPVYHHQAIDQLGDGLVVTARTSDGVIEAVELDSVPFGVAVQWHPEESRDDIRLFAGLVEAAREYRAQEQDSPSA